MKKFLGSFLLLAGSVVTGLLVWRKVEADRTDDLWAEAERATAELDAKSPQH
ncbi:DLW-39 family protein [Brachybacterium huguangmaarense]